MKTIMRAISASLVGLAVGVSSVQAADIQVTFTNNAPTGGTYLTPAWVGFHDGRFDAFSAGTGASLGIETIAEVGDPSALSAIFAGSGVDSVAGAAPVAPGSTVRTVVSLAEDGSNSFFSFASMVLPSNDFFIGNDNPITTSIAGLLDGTFSRISVDVISVYDAGTEVNDFATSAGNGLFGIPGGNAPAGTDEMGVIAIVTSDAYSGFANDGGADLSGLNFSDYDSLATFTLSAAPVPVPAALPLLLSAVGGLSLIRRRSVTSG